MSPASRFPFARGIARRRRRARRPPRWIVVAAALWLGLLPARPSVAAEERSGPEPDDLVVLLHGLARSRNNMLILEWRLERLGHRVCNVGYDTRVPRIRDAAASVRASIERCERREGGRLHFVTHSLGGLVLRALLADGAPGALGRAVMLAPPNQGSEIADRLRDLGWLEPIMGPLAPQLGTGPKDLPRTLPPPTMPFGVIAGDDWINPAGPLWLPAPHDGTVSVESTRLRGMSDHLVLPYTHTFIVAAGPVAEQVDRFLRLGAFAHGD